ncbi:MAG TPA: hypothetical protein VGE27_09450, partial [Gemmatimonas sp.]|uniref:hypothetical protein n=1 Tax=Gemmatimonas sp. TaxID=1962908 RepID=UPI002ED787F7
GLNGRPLKPIERSGAPVALTKSDIRDAIDREVADDGEDRSKQVEASYASMTFPQVLPAYTQMLVDADDHLWVRPFPRGTGNLVSWSIFTPAGALVGEVAVPRHLEVFEIGRDYVLGRYMDPKEAIPEVRLYRLKRS